MSEPMSEPILGTKKLNAVYPLSADPLHNGHVSVVETFAPLFEKLWVVIADNPRKKSRYAFSGGERAELTTKALAKFPTVEVVRFGNLLPDFLYANRVDFLLRGLRNSTDFDFEVDLDWWYKKLGSESTPIFVKSGENEKALSSSYIKDTLLAGGPVHEFVPLNVKQALEEKLLHQRIVGLTGGMGSGKTKVGKLIAAQARFPVLDLDLDVLVEGLYFNSECPYHNRVVADVIEAFGPAVLGSDGAIDKAKLGKVAFSSVKYREKLEGIIYPALDREYRRQKEGFEGLVLVNAALIADKGMIYMGNNNVIHVTGDLAIREQRCLDYRGIPASVFRKRVGAQMSDSDRSRIINAEIAVSGTGFEYVVDNSGSLKDLDRSVGACVEYLQSELGL
ncbi:pantetheine-phosphate adenylyltransferase [Candidatus Woesearchaeota archaeon]|nr:pantetheine-phosphate adenylyltransferase [Candidatus Woesearchaeota archaeon]